MYFAEFNCLSACENWSSKDKVFKIVIGFPSLSTVTITLKIFKESEFRKFDYAVKYKRERGALLAPFG